MIWLKNIILHQKGQKFLFVDRRCLGKTCFDPGKIKVKSRNPFGKISTKIASFFGCKTRHKDFPVMVCPIGYDFDQELFDQRIEDGWE